MAQELHSLAEWTFHIGGKLNSKKADFTTSDFSAVTWVEVDGVQNLGSFGDSAAEINTKLINRSRAIKSKGVRDAGTLSVTVAALIGPTPDTGQANMKAAEKTNDNYAFKITAADKGDGSGAANTIFFFVGMVLGEKYVGGDADTIQMIQYEIAINSNIPITAATAGS